MGGDGPGEGTPRAFASQASHTNHATCPPGVMSAAPSRAHATCVKTRHASHSTQPRGKSARKRFLSGASENVFSPGAAFVFVSTAFAETARRSASVVPSLAHATPPDTPKPLDANGAVRLAGFAGAATAPRSAPRSARGASSFFVSKFVTLSPSSFAVSSFAFAFADVTAKKGSGGRHGGARPHRAHAVTFRSCGWSRS